MKYNQTDSKGRFVPGIKITKICLNCGKKFIVNTSGVYRKYCSHVCSIKHKIKTGHCLKRAQKPCIQCGKPIIERPSKVKRRKFCSYKCSVEARKNRIKRECPTCKSEFITKPSQIINGKGIYCSHRCWCKSRNEVAMVTIHCENCGKEFKMLRSNALHTATDNSQRVLFCSRACYYDSENFKDKMERLKPPKGKLNKNWCGGAKISRSRFRHRRANKGFIIISDKVPYDEPIEYHHPHPNLPFVVPCPARIHKMFVGANKNHFRNVNAMLGLKLKF